MKKSALAPVVLSVLVSVPAWGEEEFQLEQPLAEAGASAPHRWALEVTPLGLFLGHYGASLEVVPVPHHAMVLSGYYSHVEAYDATVAKDPPRYRFTGVGGELGYRYYFGALGPHGLYLGPSAILGFYEGAGVSYRNVGGALDVGYQAIVGPILFGVGAGVQYVHVDRALPEVDNLYAEVTTRSAVRPRAALTFGWAF